MATPVTFVLATNASVGPAMVHSAQYHVPTTLTTADVTITAASPWQLGTGNFTWQFELSTDGGVTWNRILWQTLPIGSLDRHGGFPSIGISLASLAGAGHRLRLSARADTTQTMSASVTVS